MPTTTYIIRFAHRYRPTSVPYEEQEHTTLAAAWESFRLFAEPTSAEMYRWHSVAPTPDCWARAGS